MLKEYGPGNLEGKLDFYMNLAADREHEVVRLEKALSFFVELTDEQKSSIQELEKENEARRETQRFLSQELYESIGELANLSDQARKSERRARTDGKTGLLSPHGLEEAYRKARLDGSKITAVFMDIDNFKVYNQQLSEPVVDKIILKPLGTAIKSRARTHFDDIGRHGGDELLFMLHDTPRDDALTVAASFVDVMKTVPVPGELPPLTFSVGIAEVDTSMAFEDAITPAAQAMRSAKEAGKNCIMVA